MRLFYIAITLLFTLLTIAVDAQPISLDNYTLADRLGIAHISLTSEVTPEIRYRQALALGAGWNRWPLYWDRVQPEESSFDWAAYDDQVMNDLSHGLKINGILIGVPSFYRDENRIIGLNEPIFADGSDFAAANKEINPDNPWAKFVFAAVNRYRPGGELARERGLSTGIEHWEIWNEPDQLSFWRASIRDYARLLKVAYIVTKMADPEAQVIFGGLSYPSLDVNWLAQVLSMYANDSQHTANNWYMDIVGVHSYGDPWRSGWLTLYVRETLKAYDLSKPIWLNETGIPAWDDYPGPVWDSRSFKRATTQQQAYYLIQSAAYAWAEGADKIFYHQLYDDCGDQPAGTDFPPHSGGLCDGAILCSGDAYGLYRNPPGATCFSQHPQPGTMRPVGEAFRLLADIFGTEAFDRGQRLYLHKELVTFTFLRPRTEERITVMWNETFDPFTFEYEAAGQNAQLISLDGSVVAFPDEDGIYSIELPPATPDNMQSGSVGADAAIGGMPYIMIEKIGGSVLPTRLSSNVEVVDAHLQEAAAPTPIARPTIDPADDTIAPTVMVNPLPSRSTSPFTVTWEGQDNSGIAKYLIWVRVDGGEWQPWLETTATSAEYTGETGKTYEFAAWAVDLAGNWSDNADLQMQTGTKVE